MKPISFPKPVPFTFRVILVLTLGLAILTHWTTAAEKGAPAPAYDYPRPASPADHLGSLRELAALSSFGFSIRDTQTGQPTFVLSPLTGLALSPNRPDFSAVLIRMNRLTTLTDPELTGAAKEMRLQMIGSYQLNVANGVAGNTAVNAGKGYSKFFRKGLSWAASASRDEDRAKPRLEMMEGGRLREVPGAPYQESAETAERWDHMMAEYDSVFSDTKKLKSVSYAVDIGRGPLHRNAAAIWEKFLFPKLDAVIPPTVPNAQLLEVGQVQNFNAPPALMSLWAYGMVTFGNPKTLLTNVTVRVQSKNEFGEKGDWYAYLPVIRPGQYVQTALPSTIFRAAPLSLKIETFFSLVCDQGRMMNVPVDMGKKSNNGRSIEEVRKKDGELLPLAKTIADLLPQIAPVCTDPGAAAKALVERFGSGKTYAARGPDGIFLVRTSTFDLTPRPITLTVSMGDPQKLRTFQQPARLLTEVERGIVLGSVRDMPPASASAVQPAPVAIPPPAISQPPPVASNNPPLGSGTSLRGATLQPSSGLSPRGGGSGFPNRAPIPPPSAPSPSVAAPPDNRPVRLLTSPVEICDFRSYKREKRQSSFDSSPMMMLLTGELRLPDLGVICHSNERTVEAEFVLFVDGESNPWLQFRAPDGDEVSQFPLTEADKGAPK